MACIGDRLYYHSRNISRSAFIVLSCQYLTEIGDVKLDGTGEVESIDFSSLNLLVNAEKEKV
jgi:hypothetical protein